MTVRQARLGRDFSNSIFFSFSTKYLFLILFLLNLFTSSGQTIEHAARTCKDIQRSNTGLVHSGKYWLSPQQYDDSAFIGYCNMDVEGGGWTLAYSFKMQRRQNSTTVDVTPRPSWRKHEINGDETTSKKAPQCKKLF